MYVQPYNILCMLLASRNILFQDVWCGNLLHINDYIDQYIERNNIECVKRA